MSAKDYIDSLVPEDRELLEAIIDGEESYNRAMEFIIILLEDYRKKTNNNK